MPAQFLYDLLFLKVELCGNGLNVNAFRRIGLAFMQLFKSCILEKYYTKQMSGSHLLQVRQLALQRGIGFKVGKEDNAAALGNTPVHISPQMFVITFLEGSLLFIKRFQQVVYLAAAPVGSYYLMLFACKGYQPCLIMFQQGYIQ